MDLMRLSASQSCDGQRNGRDVSVYKSKLRQLKNGLDVSVCKSKLRRPTNGLVVSVYKSKLRWPKTGLGCVCLQVKAAMAKEWT